MRSIWSEILAARIPVVFHNGLIDLFFIYQNFYLGLPESCDEFIANISDWFNLEESCGVYDSKYVAEMDFNTKRTSLEYIFRKWFVSYLLS